MRTVLNSEQLTYFKKNLEQQLEELFARADSAVKLLSKDNDSASDLLDRATLDSGRDNTLRFRERESRLIRKIKSTLEKIDEGTFGICEACSEPIPLQRLLARPVTAYCIRCKTRMETMERAVGA